MQCSCNVETSLTGAAYFLDEGWHSTKIYVNHFSVYAMNFQYIKISFYMYTTIIQRIVCFTTRIFYTMHQLLIVYKTIAC